MHFYQKKGYFSKMMNLYTKISSPLDQFEIRNLLSLDVPVLGNIQLSFTNIGLYLTMGMLIALSFNILATNYNKIVSNNWSISQESIYATIYNIVVNQINASKGQIYFPFIFALFIFILVNNLIGMVKRCLWVLLLFISNNLLKNKIKLYSSHSHSYIHI